MNKTARFVLKMVAAGLAFSALGLPDRRQLERIFEAVEQPESLPAEQIGEQ